MSGRNSGMSAGYFVLSSSEDGTSIDGPLTLGQLKARITPDTHGETYDGRHGFHATVPGSDKGCWNEREGEEKLLIIKGEIVVPKAIATEWEVE